VPKENYAASFGFQWHRHYATQLDSYTGRPFSESRIYTASKWAKDLRGQLILEAGSGAGRFTEVLGKTGADVFTFDLSNAVEVNKRSNGKYANVRFFQGDLLNIPFKHQVFDKVICLGVIQHTPDPAASFDSLARHVKPGGSLVIDCYAKRLTHVIGWKYILRPITRRMDKPYLYNLIDRWVTRLLPLSTFLRQNFGAVGARILPILNYAHWDLPPELNKQWSTLDTFDHYSPYYDKPQTLRTVRCWYEKNGFREIDVRYGANGIVASGVRPG
jgi:SAM-dependent methyltransferase